MCVNIFAHTETVVSLIIPTETKTHTIPNVLLHADPGTWSLHASPHFAFHFQSLLCSIECHFARDALFSELVPEESFETIVSGTITKIFGEEVEDWVRGDVHDHTRHHHREYRECEISLLQRILGRTRDHDVDDDTQYSRDDDTYEEGRRSLTPLQYHVGNFAVVQGDGGHFSLRVYINFGGQSFYHEYIGKNGRRVKDETDDALACWFVRGHLVQKPPNQFRVDVELLHHVFARERDERSRHVR